MSRELSLQDIRHDVERGSYQVDPKAVADAMLRRLFGLESGAGARLAPRPRPQNECS